MAAWTAGPVAAVEEWLRLRPDPAVPGRWTRRGEAVPAAEDGWLRLDLRDRPGVADALHPPLCLAGREGPERSPAHPVGQYRVTGGVLLLRVPPDAPRAARWVWTPSSSPRLPLERLRAGLRAAGPAPLAEELAAGRLTGPPDAAVEPADGLLGGQVEAHRAARSPGLRVVWTPPGTGRTRVLARAAADALRAGRRVLLVSTDDAVLDRVVLDAAELTTPGPGRIVRVGPPHSAELVDRPDLRLEALTAAASAEVDTRRGLIGRRLVDLGGADHEIAELAARLDGYDPEEYRAAAARVTAAGRRTELRTRYQDTLGAAELAYGRVVATRRELDRLAQELAGVAGPRAALARLPGLDEDLRRLDARDAELRRALRAAQERSGPSARRRVREAAAALQGFVATAVERRRELWDRIIADRRVASATTAAELDRLDEAHARADRAATAAWRAFEPVEAELRRLERAMEQTTEVGAPSDADRVLVERSRRDGLPALHERWTRLRALRAQSAGDLAAHQDEHRRLLDRSTELRAGAAAELVAGAGLVATTLVRSRTDRAVAAAGFDVVLVDGAEAATLAEVLLVLTRATTTAVLLGDFRRPGPELPEAVAGSAHPGLRTWVAADCFAHVGIGTPQDALAHAGCVVLRHPFRTAAGARRLLDDLGYGVLRDAAELGVPAATDPEIVLVDVAGLPDLAAVRPGAAAGRWWPAGPVLAPVLAAAHRPGATVAVLAASPAQAGTTLAALRDRGLVEGVACATATARGPRSDVAVLDLVGDAADPAPVAAALAAARERLHVLVDGRALAAATTGALAALRAAVERGDARVVAATALLGLDPAPADRLLAVPPPDGVEVVDVSAAADLAAALERRLAAARDGVWMWSPWLGDRADAVGPLVAAAVGRGVRVRVVVGRDEEAPPVVAGSGATVLRGDHPAHPVVVIDRRTVLFGSAAADGGPRAALVAVEGRALAERLLVELHADVLDDARTCPTCTEPMRLTGDATGSTPRWECPTCGSGVETGACRGG